MEAVYDEHNRRSDKPFFHVSLCQPGHLNDYLNTFRLQCNIEKSSWDSIFCQNWNSGDFVDCILAKGITTLVDEYFASNSNFESILRSQPKAMTQFLILAHIYGKVDNTTLTRLRWSLFQKPSITWSQIGLFCLAGAVPTFTTAFLAPSVFSKISDGVSSVAFF